MGTGWRRAFCTSIPRDPETAAPPEKQQNTTLFRLRCRAAGTSSENPPLSPALNESTTQHCKSGGFTPTLASSAGLLKGSPRLLLTRSNPASPRSPSRFAQLKATLRLSRSRCGICSQSVRTGQRTAVFTAECSHSFHFPCISTHVRSQSRDPTGRISCPVCSASWREVTLLSSFSLHPAPTPPAAKTRIYDDDEPLQLSSSACQPPLHFNPIPESDFEDEADAGGSIRDESNGCGVEVTALPETAILSSDRNYQSYAILLRVDAPSLPQRSVSKMAASVLDPSCRAPIDLVTVLDVSESMTDAKLQLLKRAMRLLISSLGSSDRLSIVAFSAGAKRLLPLLRMSRQGQRSARQIVDRLILCGGGAQNDCRRFIDLALRKASKVLEDRRERNTVATIMLLSDSHQERAKLQHPTIRTPIPPSTEATRFAHLEIPIDGSGGGCGVVENVFSKCVSGLVSVLLQDVHLHLCFPSGSISAVYSCGSGEWTEGCYGHPLSKGEGSSGVSVNLGDFYADERRELLVELKLPLQQRRGFSSYKCCYRNPTSRELVVCGEKPLSLPPLRSISANCVELRGLFVAVRALVESRRLEEQNELDTAAQILSAARSALMMQSNGEDLVRKRVASIEMRLSELQRRRRRQHAVASELTPTSAWRAAEQLAKVAILRKSMSRVGDLHGFENARF